MTILADWQIHDLVLAQDMITPFHVGLSETGVISYGLSSTGYDCRIGNKGRIYTNVFNALIDPKAITHHSFIDVEVDQYFVIPPNSFMLAATVEYFKLPRWITMNIMNKSSYARCGIVCPGCVGEPEWNGTLTLEIANQTPSPARVYANEGIAQLQFHTHADPVVSYADRKGKYQGQTGITLPKVKGE